ncbi:transposase, partial [Vibrio sp. 10N.247.311.12]
ASYPLNTCTLEGINNKIKLIKRMGYGYRDTDYFLESRDEPQISGSFLAQFSALKPYRLYPPHEPTGRYC